MNWSKLKLNWSKLKRLKLAEEIEAIEAEAIEADDEVVVSLGWMGDVILHIGNGDDDNGLEYGWEYDNLFRVSCTV